jgi:hypothetical protein
MDHHNSSNQQKNYWMQKIVQSQVEIKWKHGKLQGKTCSKNIYLSFRNGLHIKLFICNKIDFNKNHSCLGS